MAICQILEDPDQSQEQADQVFAHERSTGPSLRRARLAPAGPANPGWRVISVWDSEEARDRFFAERLAPTYKEAGLSLDSVKRTQFEVHRLTAGESHWRAAAGLPPARAGASWESLALPRTPARPLTRDARMRQGGCRDKREESAMTGERRLQ
jgi:hypothetical protein